MDDTLRQGPQAREDVAIALLESDPRTLIQPLHAARVGDLIVQRVSRDAAEMGRAGGAGLRCLMMQELPEECYGSVLLAFDGWADDVRPLCQIPIVVEFIRGLLGDPHEWASVLQMFVDERRLIPFIPDEWYDAAGSLWLLAHTTSGYPYWSTHDGQLLRNLERNIEDLDLVMFAYRQE